VISVPEFNEKAPGDKKERGKKASVHTPRHIAIHAFFYSVAIQVQ